jgi:hypothetical protein
MPGFCEFFRQTQDGHLYAAKTTQDSELKKQDSHPRFTRWRREFVDSLSLHTYPRGTRIDQGLPQGKIRV